MITKRVEIWAKRKKRSEVKRGRREQEKKYVVSWRGNALRFNREKSVLTRPHGLKMAVKMFFSFFIHASVWQNVSGVSGSRNGNALFYFVHATCVPACTCVPFVRL